jgi:hypothetical protein
MGTVTSRRITLGKLQMSKRELLTLARELGQAAAQARSTLPSLAVAAAKEAIRGTIDEDDANELYATYAHESMSLNGKGSGGEQPLGSAKAQASKLRQIIKCASVANGNTLKLLERVSELHAKVGRHVAVKALYASMVLACRVQQHQKRPLTNQQIEKILRR